MDNKRYYDKFKVVPDDAKKPIEGGRLNGFTAISPMWRIRTLTEAFGPCGIGWNFNVADMRTVTLESGEIFVAVDVHLVYKESPESDWSAPVFGTGGAMLVKNEKAGLRADDDALTKAYTDACGIACKHLGIGADVYWDKDVTKHELKPNSSSDKEPEETVETEIAKIKDVIIRLGFTKGLDVKATKMRAEAFIENKTGQFVYFDEMTLDQLTQVKLKVNELKNA